MSCSRLSRFVEDRFGIFLLKKDSRQAGMTNIGTEFTMNCSRFNSSYHHKALVEYITYRYNRVVEIGIGHFPRAALLLLQNNVRVFATDIKPLRYKGVKVIMDDITEPDLSIYDGLDLIYSLRPPPELIPYMISLSRKLSADLIIKPLSSEHCEGQLVCYKNTSFFLWSHR